MSYRWVQSCLVAMIKGLPLAAVLALCSVPPIRLAPAPDCHGGCVLMRRCHGIAHEQRVQNALAALQQKEAELKQKREGLVRQRKDRKRQHDDQYRHVLMIMCLEAGSQMAAEAFLQRPSDTSSAGCTSVLRSAQLEYETMDSDDIAALIDDSGPRPCPVLRRAKTFVHEFNLYRWVKQQNLTKGIAPVTKVVGVQWSKESGDQASGSSTLVRSQQQWLRRWRTRWGIRLGRIAAREHITSSESQMKVSRVKCRARCCRAFRRQRRTLRNGMWVKKWCRIMAPVLGPLAVMLLCVGAQKRHPF